MKLKDTTYDFLKWLAIYFIPALTTFAGVVGIALNYPNTAILTTIIGAIGAFIASCIGMSQKAYNEAMKDEYEGNNTNE